LKAFRVIIIAVSKLHVISIAGKAGRREDRGYLPPDLPPFRLPGYNIILMC